jgi:hypothetical protein
MVQEISRRRARFDAMEREIEWATGFAEKYGIAADRRIEMYLELSEHFENKREHEKTAREVRRWEEAIAITNAALVREAVR